MAQTAQILASFGGFSENNFLAMFVDGISVEYRQAITDLPDIAWSGPHIGDLIFEPLSTLRFVSVARYNTTYGAALEMLVVMSANAAFYPELSGSSFGADLRLTRIYFSSIYLHYYVTCLNATWSMTPSAVAAIVKDCEGASIPLRNECLRFLLWIVGKARAEDEAVYDARPFLNLGCLLLWGSFFREIADAARDTIAGGDPSTLQLSELLTMNASATEWLELLRGFARSPEGVNQYVEWLGAV